MLAGQQNVGQAMFGSLMPDAGPSPEEIEAERQRILFKKHVRLQGYHVKVFDMHNPKDVVAYEKLMKKLFLGVQARTHVIWANDRQLITQDGKQGWQRYLEWSEFILDEEATPPVGVDASPGTGE